jgi:phage I-like protein
MPANVRARVKAKLEAALSKAKNHAEYEFLNVLDFADIETTDAGLPWVDAFKAGDWYDARYGVTPIDDDYLDSIIKNYNDNVRDIDIAVDFNHGEDKAKGDKAAGWIRGLRRVDDLVQAAIEFTDEATKEIRDKQWRYFSPRFTDNYVHSDGGKEYGPTMLLGSLTNTPVFKGMAPINFSEAVLDADVTLIPEDMVPAKEPEPEPEPINDPKEEAVDEAQLRQLLGIGEDDSIDDAIKALQVEAKSFSELRKKAEDHKTFAEQFPEQYKESQELKIKVLNSEAKDFAEDLAKPLVDDKGNKSKVLPPIAIEKVKDAYKEFAENKGTVDSLKTILDTVRSAGLVELGERGGSNTDGGEDKTGDMAVQEFSEKMGEIMRKDKLNPHDALKATAEAHPDLYQAYINREIPQLATSKE